MWVYNTQNRPGDENRLAVSSEMPLANAGVKNW